jgi:hypothetical protein
VREVVDEALSHPPFPQEPGPAGKLLEDFLEWFGDLFSGLGIEPSESVWEASVWVMWIAIVVVVVGYLCLLISRVISEGRREKTEPELARELQILARVQELREEARQAEAAGEYTLALRLYFFALVIGLGQQGELEYKEAWTNRELLERGAPHQKILDVLGPLVHELDAHSFGERQTEEREVRHFAELCERMLVGQSP